MNNKNTVYTTLSKLNAFKVIDWGNRVVIFQTLTNLSVFVSQDMAHNFVTNPTHAKETIHTSNSGILDSLAMKMHTASEKA